MLRRLYYSAILVLLLAAACQPAAVPSTQAVATSVPQGIKVITQPPRLQAPATDSATLPVTSTTQVATTAPTKAAAKNDPKAIHLDNMVVNLRDREILFIAYVTSQAAISSASVNWTFVTSKNAAQKEIVLPPQNPGKSVQYQMMMPLDVLPQGESSLTYHWTLTDENGNTLTSPNGAFKLTEATRADQRDDLPIIPSTVKFDSKFPDHSTFTVTIKPETPISSARFFITQNHGIYVEDYEVRVPTRSKGEALTLTFDWNATLSLQIPWQQFESWWVFIDENGHSFRTKHSLDDYADTRRHKWVRTPTKYAVLYTYNQSAANINSLVAATDHSVEALQKDFGYKLLYAPHIVIYNTVEDFKEWAPPDVAEAFIGMASGAWGGAVIGVYNSIKFTGYSIIKHELTHVFQFQSIQQNLPQWFVEGSARYMEELPEEDDEAVTRRILKKYGAPSLQVAVPMISPDKRVNGWPYYVGMTFIKFLRTKYGADVFAKTYLALARDVDLGTALQSATGKSFSELDQEWQKWIVQ